LVLVPRRSGAASAAPYALRHTFAAFAIPAVISTFEISRMMGTSLEQIEKTYGHMPPDAIERGREALDKVRFSSAWTFTGRRP